MKALWAKEPAALTALVVALVAALAIPTAWAKVIMAVVAVAGGTVTRSQVYAPATVAKLTGTTPGEPPVPPGTASPSGPA